MSWKLKIFESLVIRSWWMLLFLAASYALYSHGMEKKKQTFLELQERFCALEQEKFLAQEEHDDLLLQIKSQSDPAWIQMLLMKGLGMVPEGQVKVYFKRENSD